MQNRAVAILLFCLLAWSWGLAWAAPVPPGVCVVVSREIRPFVMMADELEAGLKIPVTRVFLDSAYRPYGDDGKFLEVAEKDFRLFIAVGPRALSYLLKKKIKTQIIYGMVLNPESFISKADTHVSGASLNIFSLTQLTLIKQVFPDIKNIGVLYDPEHNRNWVGSARLLANTRDMNLVPLSVSDSSQIPKVLEENAKKLDAVLFIPDATVISTTIIQHAIKQLILKRIPAIGYNSFFDESGAAMSFIIDYGEVGKQVANLARAYLEGKGKTSVGPTFTLLLNSKVIRLLGLKLNTDLPENVEFKQ